MSSKPDEDLILILQHPAIKVEAKLQGWNYVLGMTVSEEGFQRLVSSKYIPFITDYIQQNTGDSKTLNLAYKSLINISSSSEGTLALLSASGDLILFLLDNIDSGCPFVEQTCYLLSNITNHHKILNDERVETRFPETLKKLPNGFFSSNAEKREKYKFFSLVLANISMHPEGRKVLLEDNDFLTRLVSCNSSEEPDIRRLGNALTLRNCCFEKSIHQKFLNEIEALPFLLLPLMGVEEYEEEIMDKFPIDCQYLEPTKKRERLPQIRKALVHALALLCYTEEGWDYLKSKGTYYIVRDLHTWEEDPDVQEAIETLVGYLLVLQYKRPEIDTDASYVVPAETDILKDIPDFVI
ncbi:hypothetical protein JTE90_028533 [Oedothorax gibbosus]|uniref:Protein HGH1 homolog n=1 Tax=Oedothorax gibbosus TaxID=931172 RepID=A0AAV6VXR9_9ARAC|nr:hypothetical protein JTE90_028533 [Oedothorax gibbosus]